MDDVNYQRLLGEAQQINLMPEPEKGYHTERLINEMFALEREDTKAFVMAFIERFCQPGFTRMIHDVTHPSAIYPKNVVVSDE